MIPFNIEHFEKVCTLSYSMKKENYRAKEAARNRVGYSRKKKTLFLTI